MQYCEVCTCELTFRKNQLLPPLSQGSGFNPNKDAAYSFRTPILMWQTARQYTPKECSDKGSYMSIYQQDLLDSLLLVFYWLLQVTFRIKIHSQILKYIHMRRMCYGWHVRSMPFVADIVNCLCANIQHKGIHQRDVVAHAWLIWNLQVAA